MAVQVEAPGQVQEFLGILKRRKWQIALPAAVFLALGIASAVIVPKKYVVTTQVELRELSLAADSLGYSGSRAEGVAENAPQQIKSMKRITETIEGLKWTDYLTIERAEQNEFRGRIQGNIRVIVPPRGRNAGSSFVRIEYRDVSKDRAQQFLKALRKAWIEQVVERGRARIDAEYINLLNRKGELDKQWLRESRLITDLRVDNDISLTQPTPGKNQQRIEDPAMERLLEHADRIEEVQIVLSEARENLEIAQVELAKTEPEKPRVRVIRGMDFNLQIEELRTQRMKLEQKLDGIRPPHSRWKKISGQLTDIDERIAELELSVTEAEVRQEFEPNPDYTILQEEIGDLMSQIDRLRAKETSLREALKQDRLATRKLADAYREDSERTSRIEILTTALKDVEIKLQNKKQQREVINGPSGNPFQIVEEVEPPASPSEPDPVLIIVFSLILGMGVGFGSSLALEFSKSCFRSTADIGRVMVVPVLGVISPIVTRAQRRRRMLSRFAVGSASLVLIGAILFVTWAWASRPELLGDQLNDSIEGFRSLFL